MKNLEVSEDNTVIWKGVQNNLTKEFGEATFRSWLSKLNFVSYKKGNLELSVPTKFLREWIFNNYEQSIRKHWMNFDDSIKHLEIIVITNENCNPLNSNSCSNKVSNNLKNDSNNVENKILYLNYDLNQVLDQRFTFDSFVVGVPNEFAYAASRSVAESTFTNAKTNPLFLYGGVGLGKTHLMHAIAWYIHRNHPNRKVMYISAEKFMYQFVRALRNKEIISFKEYFRSVDVLMIDDVQFICGKDSTQEEFFHTFNALSDNNCQIVISCDRSPSDLEGMEDRIKSRLGWGLVADIHSTNYELRLGILYSKVEQMKIKVPKEVIEFLASKITTNVRELEGALNKVVAHSNLVGREITLENTAEILRDLLRSTIRTITVDEIQKKVAEHYNIKMIDLSSARRVRSIARPRQVAMYLAKILTNKSYLEIGKKFGGKDHTTVIHALKNIEKLQQIDTEIAEDIRILTKMLQV